MSQTSWKCRWEDVCRNAMCGCSSAEILQRFRVRAVADYLVEVFQREQRLLAG